MTVYAIWPAVVAVAFALLLTYLPIFHRVGFNSGSGLRVNAIDGLRGFLALAVALHHSVIYYQYIRSGTWTVPPSRFYTLIGQIGVAYFFMVTGYLFWGKIVRAKGALDFPNLMVGRLFRLGPVYVFTISIAIAILYLKSGATLHVPASRYVMEVAQNLALGVLPLVEMNGTTGIIGVTAGVTWTLQYEWLFYVMLPVLAIFARAQSWHLPAAVFALALAVSLAFIDFNARFAIYSFFGCGMVCASLQERRLVLKLSPVAASLAIIGILVIVGMSYETAYRPEVSILLGTSFYFMLGGGTIFGLLVAKPSIKLGELSYGIYLMQGVALFAVFSIAPLKAFALESDANYWLAIFGALSGLVFASLAVHILIERPGIELGRKIRRAKAFIPITLNETQ